jgi:peptidoglycan/xylan/chitin deacetylase (PgdA/CDA1 family)
MGTRVVVVGGTGHIGSYLVPRLVAGGHEVVVVTRGSREPYQPHPAWQAVQRVQIDREVAEEAGTFGQMIRGEAPAKAMVVTFDDALGSVRDRALPILQDLGIPATVFVPTAYVDRPPPMAWPGTDQWVGGPHEGELTCMSWDDLRGLAAEGWEVASHSRTHPRLTEVDDGRLRGELVESREACAREIGTCDVLAYPYGAHDERVRSAARDAGYTAAAALELGKEDPLAWPRVGIYSKDDLRRFRLKVSPLLRRLLSSSLSRRLRR